MRVCGRGGAGGRSSRAARARAPFLLTRSPPPFARRYDYDQKITPGNRFECTCEVLLEGATGDTLRGKLKTKEKEVVEWEAKRWSEQDVPRVGGKISSFSISSKAAFDRVTDNGRAKHESWAEEQRAKVLEESKAHDPKNPRKLDGAIMYIPGPASGDEYRTAHDLEREAREKEAGHRDARIAALEGAVAKLEAKAAKGEDVKEKLDKAKVLLSGEKKEKKMLEERTAKWKNGAGSFAPDSSKHAEHLPDEYQTEHELMRKLHKADLERPLKDKARMEAELPKVQAAMAAGKGDPDALKRREEFLKKMIAAKIPKPEDVKEFKPPSRVVVLASRCVGGPFLAALPCAPVLIPLLTAPLYFYSRPPPQRARRAHPQPLHQPARAGAQAQGGAQGARRKDARGQGGRGGEAGQEEGRRHHHRARGAAARGVHANRQGRKGGHRGGGGAQGLSRGRGQRHGVAALLQRHVPPREHEERDGGAALVGRAGGGGGGGTQRRSPSPPSLRFLSFIYILLKQAAEEGRRRTP